MTTGNVDLGGLLGLVIIGGVAEHMIDNHGNGNGNNNNNNQNQNQQQQQSQPRRKKQVQQVTHKRVGHSGRGLLQPRTDGDKPF
jgi:hypothetical protein